MESGLVTLIGIAIARRSRIHMVGSHTIRTRLRRIDRDRGWKMDSEHDTALFLGDGLQIYKKGIEETLATHRMNETTVERAWYALLVRRLMGGPGAALDLTSIQYWLLSEHWVAVQPPAWGIPANAYVEFHTQKSSRKTAATDALRDRGRTCGYFCFGYARCPEIQPFEDPGRVSRGAVKIRVKGDFAPGNDKISVIFINPSMIKLVISRDVSFEMYLPPETERWLKFVGISTMLMGSWYEGKEVDGRLL